MRLRARAGAAVSTIKGSASRTTKYTSMNHGDVSGSCLSADHTIEPASRKLWPTRNAAAEVTMATHRMTRNRTDRSRK